MSTHLEREIGEQPEVAARLLQRVVPDLAAFADLLRSRGSEQVLTVARGSSANAAGYGRLLWQARAGRMSGVATPSTTTAYDAHPDLARQAVVAVSQSGASPDVVAVVERARAEGRPTLAVTNDPDSPLARASEAVLELDCGPERSVAATKTYTASLLALALLGVALDDGRGLPDLDSLPAALEAAVRGSEGVEEAASLLARHERAVVVGRGFSAATARESALKLTELTGALAVPFTPADLLHGPVGAVGPGTPVLLLPGLGAAAGGVIDLLPELRERGAPLVLVGDASAVPGEPAEVLRVTTPAPARVADWLEPVVGVVPMQLVALQAAQRRGVEVDRPGGLSKVTLTH